MDRVLAQADDGDHAAGKALEAILAAQRLYAAADAKMAEAARLLGDTSAAFHAIRSVVVPLMPTPPALSGTPANPHVPLPPRKPDSVKQEKGDPRHGNGGASVVRSHYIPVLLMLGAGSWACGPMGNFNEVKTMSHENPTGPGYEALRASDLPRAEKEFAHAGEQCRVAETMILADRCDEADLILEKLTTCGEVLRMRALSARRKGDMKRFETLIWEAHVLGDFVAERLVAVHKIKRAA